jgi:hypothetical protein
MTTVGDVISRLLPETANGRGGLHRSTCPLWPPDVFAVAATLIGMSGCYARLPIIEARRSRKESARRIEEIARAGEQWGMQRPAGVPQLARRCWRSLVTEHADCDISSIEWCDDALTLLALADEACTGIGFPEQSAIAGYLFMADTIRHRRRGAPQHLLPFLPNSICHQVPPSEACVLPKTSTPQVGCTLRSMSHHLALLPPRETVACQWEFALPSESRSTGSAGSENDDRPFNLVLVPFPYVVDGGAFRAGSVAAAAGKNGEFSLRQTWLKKASGRGVIGSELAGMIGELCRTAAGELGEIHAVVLPECALDGTTADRLADELGRRHRDLELLIVGVATELNGTQRNLARMYRFHRGRVYRKLDQSKHHRWRLDRSQIRRYHLGHVLDPRMAWWEGIAVDDRRCVFTVVRGGASLAVLVCEDLARFDPVMPALLSVGPSLVIALLMDGPQMVARWPGRYATVLADDPGSSVLTFTSLGMLRRSAMPGDPELRQIALWKQSDDVAQELRLPMGAHALALSLNSETEEQLSLDGRSDQNSTLKLKLHAVRPVRLKKPPAWLQLD